MEKVGQVVRGECMEAFVGEEEELIENMVFDREPVETDEGPGEIMITLCY